MIYDRFENVTQYFKEGEPLHTAVTYAANLDPTTADGRYDIEGDALYAMVATYETSPAKERRFEAHRKYIDVQVLLGGEESIGVSLNENLQLLKEYSEEKDLAFFESPETYSSLIMEPGYFAVFYPHDMHRPNCQLVEAKIVRKVVIKIKI